MALRLFVRIFFVSSVLCMSTLSPVDDPVLANKVARIRQANIKKDVESQHSLDDLTRHFSRGKKTDIDFVIDELIGSNTLNKPIKMGPRLDVFTCNPISDTLYPLHLAVMCRAPEAVQALLQRDNCKVEIYNSSGKTPLMLALENRVFTDKESLKLTSKNRKIVKALVKKRAIFHRNLQNPDGNFQWPQSVYAQMKKKYVKYCGQHFPSEIQPRQSRTGSLVLNNQIFPPEKVASKSSKDEGLSYDKLAKMILPTTIEDLCAIRIPIDGESLPAIHTAIHYGDVVLLQNILSGVEKSKVPELLIKDECGRNPITYALERYQDPDSRGTAKKLVQTITSKLASEHWRMQKEYETNEKLSKLFKAITDNVSRRQLRSLQL